MKQGYVKLYRKTLQNPVVMKDADHFAVWGYLLLKATHQEYTTLFGGKPIILKSGQLVTGRKKIARETGVEEHKVDRILKLFKSAHQIEQQAERYGSIITILNWDTYQNSEQQNEQRVSNERATSEQPVSTIQEQKNSNTKEQKEDIYCQERKEIIAYMNEMYGTSYRQDAKNTRKLIQARLNEGFTVDDFKTVIYKKGSQWKNDPQMCRFLRPQTLFGDKFEGYLNETTATTGISRWEVV